MASWRKTSNSARWWWEVDVTPDAALLDALRSAMEQFLRHLDAQGIQAGEGVETRVRQLAASLARM